MFSPLIITFLTLYVKSDYSRFLTYYSQLCTDKTALDAIYNKQRPSKNR